VVLLDGEETERAEVADARQAAFARVAGPPVNTSDLAEAVIRIVIT
jgi:hypothetical protein